MNKAIFLRIILVFIVVFYARTLIPENVNGFPYGGAIQKRYKNPYEISVMANFDGVHYVNIAYQSYEEFQEAFFPLYPIVIASLGLIVGNNHVVAGIIISITALFVGSNLLYKVLKEHYGAEKSLFALLLFLTFPTSFYFQAVYTESLFFAFCAGTLYLLHKKKPIHASFIAALASFTRIQGIFLVFFFFFHYYDAKRSFAQNIKKFLTEHYVYAAAPFIGLGIYMVYLYIVKHDALYFLSAQPTFGANRSTSMVLLPQVYYRYIRIFLTASVNFQYAVAAIEFLFFNFSLVLSGLVGYEGLKKKNWFEVSLSMFSLAYIILPSLTGTLSSIPRYSLLCLAQYVALLPIRKRRYQVIILIAFSLLQVILLSLFSRGYFIS